MLRDKPIIALLSDCLKGQKKNLIILLIIVLLFNLLELIFPKILQVYIDLLKHGTAHFWHLTFEAPEMSLKYFWWLGILLIFIGILRWGVTYLRISLQTAVAQIALRSIREKIYAKVHSLNFRFHDKYHSGNLISNIVEDLRFINQFLENGLFPLFETTIYIIMVQIFLFTVSAKISLICSLIQWASMLMAILLLTKSFHFLLQTKEYFAEMVEDFTENMEGRLVTQSLGVNEQQKQKHFQKIDNMHNSFGKEIIFVTSFHQINVWAAYLNIFLGVTFALMIYQNGTELTTGTIFLIFFLLSSIVPRVRMQARAIDLLTRSIVTAERLQTLFGSNKHLIDNGDKTFDENSNIQFQNVFFSYIENKPVLKNINFEIKHGSLTGIVGYTGSGKSILLSLLARFYDVDSGIIKIGEHRIEEYPVQLIRKNISLVFQETFLYSTSIYKNISFGKPDATIEEVQEAARLACIHDFIMTLPNGYETEVGEKGVSLSGGQKQRIGIARALIMKPNILLLDDCTSALDAHTEKEIIINLSKNRSNLTTIFTTQRLSSLKPVSEILVMKEGEIIERGKLENLIKQGTFFSEIFNTKNESGS